MIHLTASLALFAAFIPLALGMLPDVPGESSTSTTATPTNLPQIPVVPSAIATALPAGSPAQRIHPLGRNDLCFTVQGGELVAGAEVGIAYCAIGTVWSYWQLWDVKGAQSSAGGRITITETNAEATTKPLFCLGIGDDTESGGRPRLEQCVEPAAAAAAGQTWTVTTQSIKNARSDCGGDKNTACNLCLDIRMQSPAFEGTTWASCRDVQVWSCAENDKINLQQMWTLMDPNGKLSGSTPEQRAIRARSRHRA